jgi:hypothetical protein
VVTAGAAAHNVRAARAAYALHPGSVIECWLPQSTTTAASCSSSSPWSPARRACSPPPRPSSSARASGSSLSPSSRPRARPSRPSRCRSEHGRTIKLGSLRNLILVNEPIYKSSVYDFVEHFARAGLDASSVSPSYGLTYNCTFVSSAWRGTEPKLCSSLPSYKKLLPEAQATEIEIVVVDAETGAPVVDGVEGEIWISSPSNASGYLTRGRLWPSWAELQKGRGDTTRLMSGICDGIRRAVWKEEGIQVGSVVLVECGGLSKTTSGKLRRGAAREKLLASEHPKVFVAHYADESTSTRSRDGSKETVKCSTSWVVPEATGGEVAGMVVMASGNASQRLRLQSSLLTCLSV